MSAALAFNVVARGLPSYALRPATPVLGFAADAEIFAEGDTADTLYKVVSGMVRSCAFLSDGRRHIDAFHKPGDVFGFEPGAEHELSAEAVIPCTVIPYRRRALEDDTAANLYAQALRGLSRARQHARLLGRTTAGQRIASFLLEMVTPVGEVDLPMTRQDIADYLSLTVETVSRNFTAL